MAIEFAHLVFLSGPEQGRLVRLDALPVTMGRGSACPLRVSEPFASREQALFSDSPDGPVIENLSAKGTEIAGKTYKAGRKILLATGDVIRLGRDTEILFVAPGDDPLSARDELLAARQAQAVAAEPEPPELEPVPVEELPEPEPEPSSSQRRTVAEEPEPLTAAESQALAGRRRMRKIYIGLGVYLALMVVAGIALSFMKRGQDTGPRQPPRLTGADIRRHLERPVEGLFPNSQFAADALQRARRAFRDRRLASHPEYHFETLQAYKEYLAYSGQTTLANASDYDNYNAALDELHQEVHSLYGAAYAAMQAHRWHAAEPPFNEIKIRVPDPNNPIHRNVAAHLKYIDQQRRAAGRSNSRFGG